MGDEKLLDFEGEVCNPVIPLELDFTDLVNIQHSNNIDEDTQEYLYQQKCDIEGELEQRGANESGFELKFEGCGFYVAFRDLNFDEEHPKYITGILTCHHVVRDSLSEPPAMKFRVVDRRNLSDHLELTGLKPIYGNSRRFEPYMDEASIIQRKDLDYVFYPCSVPKKCLHIYREPVDKGMGISMLVALSNNDPTSSEKWGEITATNKSLKVREKPTHAHGNLVSIPGLSGCPIITREFDRESGVRVAPQLVCLHRGGSAIEEPDESDPRKTARRCISFGILAQAIEKDIHQQLKAQETTLRSVPAESITQNNDSKLDDALRIICFEKPNDTSLPQESSNIKIMAETLLSQKRQIEDLTVHKEKMEQKMDQFDKKIDRLEGKMDRLLSIFEPRTENQLRKTSGPLSMSPNQVNFPSLLKAADQLYFSLLVTHCFCLMTHAAGRHCLVVMFLRVALMLENHFSRMKAKSLFFGYRIQNRLS